MEVKIISTQEAIDRISHRLIFDYEKNYLGFYSDHIGGICMDPRLMVIPIDDHIVHRGDGVFEAFRYTSGSFYLLKAHLDRLKNSAQKIGLHLPQSFSYIEQILADLVKMVGTEKELIFRLFLSRGSGGFTTNPYETTGSQMHLIACKFKPIATEKYLKGAIAGRSAISQKEGMWANIKSCNYLQNVLMKKEAIDRNLDFVFSFTTDGFLAESSTENVMIVDRSNNIRIPKLGTILSGTTMLRAIDLAQAHLKNEISGVLQSDIKEEDLFQAKEIFMAGTTLDILPVSRYEGRPIPDGPIGMKLNELVKIDQKTNPN